ncbi:MAG TPA: helix-turn-helix domain-containing protein [Kofleriaceae bacterium]|nr:helix-turn-helix domain-containing protein [Kofleriaceae bacterium]
MRPSLDADAAAPDHAATRPQRADARRNRERLLAAADTVFSTRGADASMNDVAREAGVGIGTLYRHFATREELLAAACNDRLLAMARATRRAAASASAIDALTSFLAALVKHASMYRGLAASFGVVLQGESPGCHATTEVGRELLDRARAAGEVRADVTMDDVICIITAISLAVQAQPADARRVDHLVGLFLDGVRQGPAARNAPTRKSRARTKT